MARLYFKQSGKKLQLVKLKNTHLHGINMRYNLKMISEEFISLPSGMPKEKKLEAMK